MSEPLTKPELISRMQRLQETAAQSVSTLPAETFFAKEGAAWSAADYFKHILLSVKPLVKGLERTPERLKEMFDASGRASRSYDEVVAAYQKRLDEGIRAEDYDGVVPMNFRIPEGTPDEKSYLVDVWNDAHQRLFQAISSWTDSDLDGVQIPHPALGMITVREMLYFTLYHNSLHWQDIQNTLAAV